MARGKKPGHVPKYCHHKATGRAYVTLDGRPVYLGTWNSPESRQFYDRKIAEWLAAGRGAVPARGRADLGVDEMLVSYLSFAATYYVKHDKPTSQIERIRRAIGACVRLYGDEAAAAFGPSSLKAVRASLVAEGLCRDYANALVGCLVRAWQWAVEEELIGAEVWHALQAVRPLAKGRTVAPDHEDVTPAPPDAVSAALECLTPTLADCALFQLWTGARPGEALALRGCDLDRRSDVWLYVPQSHKNEHRGKGRTIYVGAACQRLLVPYLERLGDGYLFSPRDSMARFRAEQRASRRTPVQPSQEDRARPKPKRPPGERYTHRSYDRAVSVACERAGVEHWSPGQLRHNAATRFRAEYGWEITQHLLGHSTQKTTAIYVAESMAKALAAVRRGG